jgi:glycosyltransferase involved in cell wall biosynthesis
MKILVLSQCYEPEAAAATVRVKGLAKAWQAAGHQVTVLTGFPNYPTGKRFAGFDYGNRRFKQEQLDGINIVRTFNLFYRSGQSLRRVLDHLSFLWSASRWASRLTPGAFDLVLGTSPHSFVLPAAVRAARACKSPCILDIRDHWPQTAPKGGLLTNLLWKVIGLTVAYAYPRADFVVGVSPEYANYAAAFGVGPDRYQTIPNGFDANRFPWPPKRALARETLGLAQDAFVVSFIGTVGTGMGLGTALEALELLAPAHPDLRLLVVGQGASREALERTAAAKGLPVSFRDYLPEDQVHLAYAASDLSLACLEDRKEHRGRIPAKTFEILGSGLPMLALIPEGPAWDIVRAAGGGVRIQPGDAPALAKAMEDLKAAPDLRRTMGASGRSYILAHHSREAMARLYLDLMERLRSRPAPGERASSQP